MWLVDKLLYYAITLRERVCSSEKNVVAEYESCYKKYTPCGTKFILNQRISETNIDTQSGTSSTVTVLLW